MYWGTHKSQKWVADKTETTKARPQSCFPAFSQAAQTKVFSPSKGNFSLAHCFRYMHTRVRQKKAYWPILLGICAYYKMLSTTRPKE